MHAAYIYTSNTQLNIFEFSFFFWNFQNVLKYHMDVTSSPFFI